MQLSVWKLGLILLASASVCTLERTNHSLGNSVTCPQGLSKCKVTKASALGPRDDCGPARVRSVNVKPKLCCDVSDCKPCLWTHLDLAVHPRGADGAEGSGPELENSSQCVRTTQAGVRMVVTCDVSSGVLTSGDWGDDGDLADDDTDDEVACEEKSENEASITVCYTRAGSVRQWCRRVRFTVTPPAAGHAPLTVRVRHVTLVEAEHVEFGDQVKVSAGSPPVTSDTQVPTLRTVCSTPHHVTLSQCRGPRFELRRHGDVVRLHADQHLNVCVKRGREGNCWPLENRSVAVETLTDCMCFQAWKGDSPRTEICPYEERSEYRANVLRGVSVSVRLGETLVGVPLLRWTLLAPCRIRAELRPCLLQPDASCSEVTGSAQQCCSEGQWEENRTALWASGMFRNISVWNQERLCLMLHVEGKRILYCHRPLARRRWMWMVVLPLLLAFLTLFLLLRRSVREWNTSLSQDVTPPVLLLHASDADPRALCAFARLLSALGFPVLLDLWRGAELCALGPTAWLHAHLKYGGPALLVLSAGVLQRARDLRTHPAHQVDVLTSALGCLLAGVQQGGDLRRFLLVQLDGHECVGGACELPALLGGLALYHLPSQARAFLTHLRLRPPAGLTEMMRRVWWLRWAQRKMRRDMTRRARAESTLTQMESISLILTADP